MNRKQAEKDYPYVPRAVLELLDFHSGPNVETPYIKDGERPKLESYLMLSGCRVNTDTAAIFGNRTVDPEGELVVGKRLVYLLDLNDHFKRRFG